MTGPDRLLTPSETSEYLNGIPLGTLAQWRSQRTGPPYLKIGKHCRYRVSDLEAWLATQRKNAA